MKISYLVHWEDRPSSGAFKKILGQAAAWSKLSHEVSLFVLASEGSPMASSQLSELGLPVRRETFASAGQRLRATHALVQAIIESGPGVVYYRYATFFPSFVLLKRSVPVVVEINSDDVEEARRGLRAAHWYNLLTRRLQLSAAGLVFPTRELAARARFQTRRPHVVIANGIDLDDFTPLPPAAGSTPTLTFMGSRGHAWHGLDKVLALAAHFPQWTMHVIGSTREELPGEVPPNLQLHGFLDRASYTKILAGTDVAIGSLAVSRNNVTEACTLKVREYLAFGLPTIIGYRETDFPQGAPFLLDLPATEDNLDWGAIEAFVLAWRGRRLERAAVAHLDTSIKERARLEFFHTLARRTRKVTHP